MKWIFLAGLLVLIPLLTAIFKARPKYLLHACYLMGLLLFFLEPYLHVAPIAWNWPGPVKGVEVSVLEAISVSIILATRPVRIPFSLKVGFLLYVTGLIVSTVVARQWMPSVFYAWQLLRAVLVFVAVARASAMIPNAPIAMFAGMGTGIFFEAMLATTQFIGGNLQAGGTLGHRNILGLASHFAVMPAFALLIAGRRTIGGVLIVFAGATIAYVGGSRATIGLFAIGFAITTLISIWHKMTGRKIAFAAAAVVAVGLAAPAMKWAIERRPEQARVSSNEERSSLTEAARMIIADHPLGVGANQYIIVANVGGYSDRAGVSWQSSNRAAPVHNSYYLVTAELGFVGLLGLLATLISMILIGLAAIRRIQVTERAELLIGSLAASIVVCLHLAYEWLFMTFYVHYLLAMNIGVLVGIAAALEPAPHSRRRRTSGLKDRLASQPG